MSWPWWAGALCSAPYWAVPVGMVIQGELKPRLQDWAPLDSADAPLLSVIVPARNESSNIETCITCLKQSRYPKLEIIVVNDRSTDDTLERARRAAADDRRVRVIDGAELPHGWFGKTWACWQGYQASRGEVLLFTDADTRHGPDLHGRAVAVMSREKAELVTVLQRQEMKTFWERVMQPVFLALGALLTAVNGGAEAINRSKDPRKVIANGQFILVTRGSYEEVGGHEAIKGVVVEDLMLGLMYGRAGKTHWLGFAFDDMSTRMYDSLSAIVEGWGKNLFMSLVEVNGSVARAYAWAPLFLLPVLFVFLPLAALGHGLFWHQAGGAAFGVSGYLAMTCMTWYLLRLVKEPGFYAPFHPIGWLMMSLVFLRAVWRGPRRIEWRGRTYVHGVGERPA